MGTFAVQHGHGDRPQDILRPFYKDSNGNYWTSKDAREVTALRYTHPGLKKWKYTKPGGSYDKERHIKVLERQLNFDYNFGWAAVEKVELTDDRGQPDGVGLMSLRSLQEKTKRIPIDLIGIDDYVVNLSMRRIAPALFLRPIWLIRTRFALNGINFTIHIFVGKVPDELPYSFQEPGTEVGVVVNFYTEPGSMGSSSNGCPNCRKQ
ncbi:hypothetical protein MMC14_002848 [Varicellaria rhodocarpa]|nr:hypothetical protein [Varicellaria rhodocarpa]